MEINKKYVMENANIIDVLFNEDISLKGNDLKEFLKIMPNVTNYGLPATGGIANMNGLPLHLAVNKHFSDKPQSRYQILCVNTSNLLEPGEHWFIVGSDWGGNDPIKGDHFMFDSYGRDLTELYLDSGEKIPKTMTPEKWKPINNSIYQSINTNVCGHYCLDIISLLNNNYDLNQISLILDHKYMNKRHPIFNKLNLYNTESALSNDITTLKNAEILGSMYTPNADWYKKLRNELYE